jgi:hypothetical protein
VEHFDGRWAPMTEIPGQEDRGHATAAELPLDRVASIEIRLQSFADVGQ